MSRTRSVVDEYSLLLLALVVPFGFGASPLVVGSAGTTQMQATAPALPKEKQTLLGLYVTAMEAYEKWKADPEKVKILDVRSTEEVLFVGHPAMAWNIRLFQQTYEWDAGRKRFPMKPNPEFHSRVKELVNLGDTLLVMCRSGGRSAIAVNHLADAGFKNVYNVVDGMEGATVDDPASVLLISRSLSCAALTFALASQAFAAGGGSDDSAWTKDPFAWKVEIRPIQQLVPHLSTKVTLPDLPDRPSGTASSSMNGAYSGGFRIEKSKWSVDANFLFVNFTADDFNPKLQADTGIVLVQFMGGRHRWTGTRRTTPLVPTSPPPMSTRNSVGLERSSK